MLETIEIRPCLPAGISRVGRFYDNVILWLNDHVNYPRWIYGVYPSERSVRALVEEGSQYICVEGQSILGAFALSDKPQGNFQKGQWSQNLAIGENMVLSALAIDPKAQGQGLGSRIICYCAEKAKSEGYKALLVDAVPTNMEDAERCDNGYGPKPEDSLEVRLKACLSPLHLGKCPRGVIALRGSQGNEHHLAPRGKELP